MPSCVQTTHARGCWSDAEQLPVSLVLGQERRAAGMDRGPRGWQRSPGAPPPAPAPWEGRGMLSHGSSSCSQFSAFKITLGLTFS